MKYLATIFIYLLTSMNRNTRPIPDLNTNGIHKELRLIPKNTLLKKTYINKFSTGHDERYNQTDDSNIMDQIGNYIYKKEILDILTNVKVSIPVKMDIVEKLNKYNNTMASNLEAGGLYDNWNMDLEQ